MGYIIKDKQVYSGNSDFIFSTLASAQQALSAGLIHEGATVYVRGAVGGGIYKTLSGAFVDFGVPSADRVDFDNTESELDSTDMQGAIDEIVEIIKGISYDPESETVTIPSTIGVYDSEEEMVVLAL